MKVLKLTDVILVTFPHILRGSQPQKMWYYPNKSWTILFGEGKDREKRQFVRCSSPENAEVSNSEVDSQ